MKITPGYAENIIVAIIKNNSLSWYIADKEIWYMDYAKRIGSSGVMVGKKYPQPLCLC